MIELHNEIICISDEKNVPEETDTTITIGRKYICKSVWGTHNRRFVGFFDDKNCYRNMLCSKFIKSDENFNKKRFELLLKR